MSVRKNEILKILALILLVLLTACNGGGAQGTPPPNAGTEIPPVTAVEQLILAEGRVIPVQRATLGFSVSGVVEEVMVEEGENVESGAVIASLRGKAQSEAAVAAAELELVDAQLAYDTVIELEAVARAEAHQALVDAQEALDDAEEDRESKDYSRASQETLDIARANLVIAEDLVTQKEYLYDTVDSRAEDDPIRAEVFAQLSSAKKERNRQQANLNWLLGLPDELEVSGAEAELELAQAQVEQAESAWEEVKNGIDPDTLAQVEARLKNAEAQLAAANAALADMFLIAPFDGTVVSNDLIVGELVSPTASLVVIGDLTSWQVETTDLTELDIVKIKVGDRVLITFDALPEVALEGTVEKVRVFGENLRGDVTYRVVVALDEQLDSLLWNMTALIEFTE